jgi:Mce-associated membrane protein
VSEPEISAAEQGTSVDEQESPVEAQGTSAAEQEISVDEHGASAEAPGTDRKAGIAGRATVLALLVAVVALGSGAAVWEWAQVRSLRDGNAAVADPAATTTVTGQVSEAIKEIFSYDYDNLDRTQRAASSLLVDGAVSQYQTGFAAARQQAVAQKLIRTTTISSIGVRELHGDTARLLIFVDQQTLNTTDNQQSSSAAALDVTAREINGSWKLADITPW